MATTTHADVQRYCCWPEMAAALVEERPLDGDGGVGAVLCPGAHAELAPRTLRHTACCALFRTPQGTVWMLRTVGYVWTDQRLDAVLGLLTADRAGLPLKRDPMLARRLARALEVPQVQVGVAALDPIDRLQWETRKLALAVRMQRLLPGGRDPVPAVLAAEVDAIENALVERLAVALRRFAESLDRDVLAAVPASARDTELYAYLADPKCRRNRLQFATTFPLFLRAAATGGEDNVGGLIRRTVDDGAPFVRTLARQWAVSPGVLRTLCFKPVEIVGAQWESNIEALVVTLNALPVELRPGADPVTWRSFNEYIAFAESLFGRRPWTSPLALAWLRQAAKRGWTTDTIAEARVDLRQESVALVDELRQALIETLKAESVVAQAAPIDGSSLAARAWHSADHCLSQVAPRRLIALAQRYRRELAVARCDLTSEIAFAGGTGFWPLLPEDHVSSDGSRVVVSLDNRQALRTQGRAVVNCLGDSHLDHYASACARGDAFIVAVLDAWSRTPLSTAEVKVRRRSVGGPRGVWVVQHTAARNARPTPQCQAALQEAITALGGAAGQAHLGRGLRALAARRRGDLHGLGEADRLAMSRAVRRTIGDGRYQELLSLLRDRVERPSACVPSLIE